MKNIIILIIILLISGCQLPDNSESYTDKLVVFGNINMFEMNEDIIVSSIDTIHVSLSSSINNNIDNSNELYINDAEVILYGNFGPNHDTLVVFENVAHGKYLPEQNSYLIYPNTEYRLEVKYGINEDNSYEYEANSKTITPQALEVSSLENIWYICEECSDPTIYDQTTCENQNETWTSESIEIDTINMNNFATIFNEVGFQVLDPDWLLNSDNLNEYSEIIDSISLSRYGCSVGSFASKPYFYIDFDMQDTNQSVIRTLSYALESEKMGLEPWTDLNQDGIADKGEFFDYNYNEIHDETRINTFYDTTTVFKLWKGPYWRDENYNPYLDNPFIWNVETSPYPIMWLFFNYYGKHIMYIQSTDAAYYEYLSGDPLGQNIYLLPDSNINDGYGLFYSTFSTPFFLNVERAD